MRQNQNSKQKDGFSVHELKVTRQGNPARPEGEAGREMLERMNRSHYEVTGWSFSFWDVRPQDRILDIGCGGGMTLQRLSKMASEGHLIGLDYSPVSVQQSREINAKDIAAGKMEIIEGSVADMPFEDHTFDKIITVESFYFWPDPAENLKEVRRVLKKGGMFHLVADMYKKEGLTKQQEEAVHEYHLFNPDKKEFETLFIDAGFVDVKIYIKNGTDWICVEGRNLYG